MRGVLIALIVAMPGTWVVAQPAYVEPELTPADRSHWAFQPIRNDVSRKSLDDFLPKADRPEASRRQFIVRLSLDLHGLPPTPAEVEAFERDDDPNAYGKLVDRLLASPHYGERQAQHWLDIVRFAESNGYELDADRPNAWRYRDYVVSSFNDDKSYFDFVREQIAGDEFGDAKSKPERLIATGFLRCGPVHVVSGNLDSAVVRQEVLTEMVAGVGSAVLGLTLGCARCHDHKFDPLSQGDYYRLEAYFAGTRFKDYDLATPEQKKATRAKTAEVKAKADPVRKAIAAIDQPIRDALKAEKTDTLDTATKAALAVPKERRTNEQRKLIKQAEGVLTVRWDEILERLTPNQKAKRDVLRAELFRIEEALPAPLPEAWAVETDEQTPATFVLKRGDVKRRTLQVAPLPIRIAATRDKTGTTRSDLANWLVDAKNPLTARVIVNRLWQQHFGTGLVATPNDFGTRGGKPTNPELIDWLAHRLIHGPRPGSLKEIHRLIVNSKTYRQRDLAKVRLDAESIRDRILTASGGLNRQVGGPSVRIPLEPEVYDLIFTEDEPDHLWRVTADEKQHGRRSLYLYAKRNVRYPMLEAFDQPDGINSCAVRGQSTFAPQALILMNGSFARSEARRLATLVGADVELAYARCLNRAPTGHELAVANAFLETGTMDEFCLALFNVAEFVMRP
jgi:hypothetical protein